MNSSFSENTLMINEKKKKCCLYIISYILKKDGLYSKASYSFSPKESESVNNIQLSITAFFAYFSSVH